MSFYIVAEKLQKFKEKNSCVKQKLIHERGYTVPQHLPAQHVAYLAVTFFLVPL